MTEGKLKEQIRSKKEMPWDMHDILDEDVSWVRIHDVWKIIEEMKKDFFPVKPIWGMKALKASLKNDGTLTQMEKAFIKQTIKIMEWFGEYDD